MLKTIRNAWKIEEIRKRILFTLLILVIVRIGCAIPTPGINTEYFAAWFASQAGSTFNFFDVMTGGSFMNQSIFALNITPYITSSIIMQLLTIAIPALEEMSKEESGKQRINDITRYLTVVLALIEAAAMTIGFGRYGLLNDFTWYNVVVATITMTVGSLILMWFGEKITEKGIGNGISMILVFNILSSFPGEIKSVFDRFVFGQSVPVGIIAAIIIIAILVALTAFTVQLCAGERRVPIQYSSKIQGRRSFGGRGTNMPIKVNTAGVIPVIFASSLLSIPALIASFVGVNGESIPGKIIAALTTSNWCKPEKPIYTLGMILYIVLIMAFAYFYTSITYNPIEVSRNLTKSGGVIPGIRPGKPTSDFLNHILNYLVFYGGVGLIIIAVIPIVLAGLLGVTRMAFTGTSLIIIVGVCIETISQIESMMRVRRYDGFLND